MRQKRPCFCSTVEGKVENDACVSWQTQVAPDGPKDREPLCLPVVNVIEDKWQYIPVSVFWMYFKKNCSLPLLMMQRATTLAKAEILRLKTNYAVKVCQFPTKISVKVAVYADTCNVLLAARRRRATSKKTPTSAFRNHMRDCKGQRAVAHFREVCPRPSRLGMNIGAACWVSIASKLSGTGPLS